MSPPPTSSDTKASPSRLNLRARPRDKTVGLIGFGAFGRLIFPLLAAHFGKVVVHDPSPAPGVASVMFAGLGDAARADVVVLAAPVQEMRAIAHAIAPHLKEGALVLDVGSVKCLPAAALAEELPAGVSIVGTHPLFGPQSAADGVHGHKIVLCPVRGAGLGDVRSWLRSLGLRVLVRTPEQHDREMAVAQGLTHMIGKLIADMGVVPSITTPSFDHLLAAARMVSSDAAAVFTAIQRDNPFVAEVQDRFFALAETMRGSFATGATQGTASALPALARPIDREDGDPEQQSGHVHKSRKLAQAAVPRLIGRADERQEAGDRADGQAKPDAHPSNSHGTPRHWQSLPGLALSPEDNLSLS